MHHAWHASYSTYLLSSLRRGQSHIHAHGFEQGVGWDLGISNLLQAFYAAAAAAAAAHSSRATQLVPHKTLVLCSPKPIGGQPPPSPPGVPV